MQMRKKYIIIVMVFAAVLTMTACSQEDNRNKTAQGDGIHQEEAIDTEKVIFTVGDKEVTYSEIMFYVLCVKEQYESYFGKDIWNVSFGEEKTFEDMCKEDILNEIVQLKIITSKAEEQDVTVTEDESEEIADTVREQLEEIIDTDAKKYGITKELLQSIYHDNYLSSKMFDVATGDVDTNITDGEARRGIFQVLLVMTDGENKSGEIIKLNKKEKKEAKAWAGELRTQALETSDFHAFASSYSDSDEIDLSIGTGTMGDTFDKAAFALKDGEISKVIKGKEGYYIIYCVSASDEDATMAAKEKIISERQDKAFRDIYEGWLTEFKVVVNEQEWDKILFTDAPKTGIIPVTGLKASDPGLGGVIPGLADAGGQSAQ